MRQFIVGSKCRSNQLLRSSGLGITSSSFGPRFSSVLGVGVTTTRNLCTTTDTATSTTPPSTTMAPEPCSFSPPSPGVLTSSSSRGLMRRVQTEGSRGGGKPSFSPILGATTTTTFGPTTTMLQQRRFQHGGGADPYQTLGVSRSASQDEIKQAYKKLVMQYHPDKNKSPGAEQKFKEISAAYSTLKDANKRRDYDAMNGFGGGGGRSGFGTGPGTTSYSSSSGMPRGARAQQMSQADADRLFREAFGSRGMDDIFKDFYAKNQSGPNPYGNDPNAKVTKDEYVRDQRGNTYRVTTWETSSPQGGGGGGGPNPDRFGSTRGASSGSPIEDYGPFGGGGGGNPFSSFMNQSRAGGNPFRQPPGFGGFGGQQGWAGDPFSPFGGGGGGGPQQHNAGQQQTSSQHQQQQQQQSTSNSSNQDQQAHDQWRAQQEYNPFRQGIGNQNYWANGPGFSPLRPAPFSILRLMFWCFVFSLLFTSFFQFLFQHPGLLFTVLFCWILLRRPRM